MLSCVMLDFLVSVSFYIYLSLGSFPPDFELDQIVFPITGFPKVLFVISKTQLRSERYIQTAGVLHICRQCQDQKLLSMYLVGYQKDRESCIPRRRLGVKHASMIAFMVSSHWSLMLTIMV